MDPKVLLTVNDTREGPFLQDQNLNGIGPRLYLDVDQPMTCDHLNQFPSQIECEETDKEIKIGRLIKDGLNSWTM